MDALPFIQHAHADGLHFPEVIVFRCLSDIRMQVFLMEFNNTANLTRPCQIIIPKTFRILAEMTAKGKNNCQIIRGYLYMRKVSAKWLTRMLDQ